MDDVCPEYQIDGEGDEQYVLSLLVAAMVVSVWGDRRIPDCHEEKMAQSHCHLSIQVSACKREIVASCSPQPYVRNPETQEPDRQLRGVLLTRFLDILGHVHQKIKTIDQHQHAGPHLDSCRPPLHLLLESY